MAYPASIDSFTPVTGADVIASAHVNALQTAIVAVQTEVGADPAGTAATVLARLAVSLAADGDLAFTGVSTLTISGGAVTATGNRHIVDTQGAAATDDLDTINGGAAGMVVVLRIVDGGRNVVITNAGNIVTPTGASITLDTTAQPALFIYDGGLSKWLCLTTAGYFFDTVYNLVAKTADYTMAATDYTCLVTASAANITITLPATASNIGRVYNIKKMDATAYTVIIDGNAAETIDGDATQIISNPYDSLTIQSTGTAWVII
jgi:hypothetical protein